MTRPARWTGRAAGAAIAAGLAIAGCVDLQVSLPGAVVEVRVTPDTVAIRVGDSTAIEAAPLDNTSALRTGETVAWASSAPSVATVDAAGLVRGVSAGAATITAAVGGVQGQGVVLVTGQPAAIAAFTGDGQSGAVNDTLAVAPSVRVTDAGGNPVSGVSVTFAVASGGGSIDNAGPFVTGLDGVAGIGAWVLGPFTGTNTVTATAADAGVAGNPVTFTATGTVGPPDADSSTVTASPAGIVPSNGLSFTTITVTVRDSAGSTISGATVTLAASGTGNFLTQPADTTDAQGQTTGTFASSVAEMKTITATVNGTVMVAQAAMVDVSANVPAQLGVATQPGGAVSNADFTVQPVVEIQDAFGNPVPSANGPVTVSLVSGNGTLVTSTSFTVNAVNGVATFSGLRIRGTRTGGDTLGTGTHRLQFTSPGFSAIQSANFTVNVSFSYNIVDIFGRNLCTNTCHGAANDFRNYSAATGSTAISCTPRTRVVAGSLANSFLYEKITQSPPSCGSMMPTGGLMSVTQRNLVRDWILQGAPNN